MSLDISASILQGHERKRPSIYGINRPQWPRRQKATQTMVTAELQPWIQDTTKLVCPLPQEV